MIRFNIASTLAASLFLLTLSGCGSSGSAPAASGDPEADRRAELRVGADGKKSDSRTLYDRLGGEPGIAAIVDDMTDRVIADPRVNFERKNVKTNWVGSQYKSWQPTPESVQSFKVHMVQFLSLAAGGPTQYTGRDMATVHKGMRITNNEFDAMVGDIKASMDRLGIAAPEKRDLLAIVETTRKQIVEKQ
ncbi:MAG: group I truncated hemoglobin [Phycisphaerales bacterium]